MPGLILNFLLDRARAARDEAAWLRQKQLKKGLQEGRAQWEWRRTQPYDFSQRPAKKVPFFGSDPTSGPFMDYVQTRSIPVAPLGVREGVSRPIRNRRSSTIGLQAANLQGKSELQETRRAGLTYKSTDQQAPKRGSAINWDGKVRNVQKRPSYLTATRSKEETPADKIARSMKSEPYSFF